MAGGFDVDGLPIVRVVSQAEIETGTENKDWVYREFEIHPQVQARSGFRWTGYSLRANKEGSLKLQAVKGSDSGIKIKLFQSGNKEPIIEAYPRGNNALTVYSKDVADILLLISAFKFALGHAPLIVPDDYFPSSRVPGP